MPTPPAAVAPFELSVSGATTPATSGTGQLGASVDRIVTDLEALRLAMASLDAGSSSSSCSCSAQRCS